MCIPDFIYKAGGIVAPPLLLPVLLSTSRGRARIPERFGFWKVPHGKYTWFHGASMGEVRGLLPLIRKRKEQKPEEKILLTATSITGLEAGAVHADAAAILPFDHPFWIRRALKGLVIDQCIIAETELWPALMEELHAAGIPVSLVNARISRYSFPRYLRFRRFLAVVLSKFERILCSDLSSQSRFISLGAPDSVVQVAGNTKYDTSPSVAGPEEADEIRSRFFHDEAPVFVAGSLRPGEEDVIFPAIASLRHQGLPFNCVIAPRHQEKFQFFAERLAEFQLPFRRWSEKDRWQPEDWSRPLVLLDAFGMLEKTYSFASLAFVGATLVDIGGHNPLEASAYAVPVMMGPNVANVEEVCEALRAANALHEVRNTADVLHVLELMCRDPDRLRAEGDGGKDVWNRNRGTVNRIYGVLFEADSEKQDAA